MALLPSIGEITRILDLSIGQGRYRKEKRSEFFTHVAEDARTLADLWRKALTELQASGRTELPDDWASHWLTGKLPNSDQYARLTVFYQNAARVVGNDLMEEHPGSIFDHLGNLLHQRNITRDMYLKTIREMSSRVVSLDNSRDEIDWSELSKVVAAVEDEAATLEALVITYKATS
jgi:hypothetical protein